MFNRNVEPQIDQLGTHLDAMPYELFQELLPVEASFARRDSSTQLSLLGREFYPALELPPNLHYRNQIVLIAMEL